MSISEDLKEFNSFCENPVPYDESTVKQALANANTTLINQFKVLTSSEFICKNKYSKVQLKDEYCRIVRSILENCKRRDELNIRIHSFHSACIKSTIERYSEKLQEIVDLETKIVELRDTIRKKELNIERCKSIIEHYADQLDNTKTVSSKQETKFNHLVLLEKKFPEDIVYNCIAPYSVTAKPFNYLEVVAELNYLNWLESEATTTNYPIIPSIAKNVSKNIEDCINHTENSEYF
jgi:hypothetical protein